MPTEKQRREAARRKAHRQLQRRQEQATRRRRNNLIGSIIGAIVIVGLVVFFIVDTGGDSSKDTAAGSNPTGTTSAAPTAGNSPSSSAGAAPVAAYPCTWTKSGTPAKKVTVPPTTKPPKKGTVDVDVQTSQGTMTFALNRAEAPCAAESFVSLTHQSYFNKTPCQRLTSGGLNVLQCGDPTGTGTGGPGYSFGDELSGKPYTRGVLAMANSGADTNGSQFFIVYKDSPLPAKYTVFGKVTKGLKVVDKVAAKGSDPAGDGKPKLPINLTKVTVAK